MAHTAQSKYCINALLINHTLFQVQIRIKLKQDCVAKLVDTKSAACAAQENMQTVDKLQQKLK